LKASVNTLSTRPLRGAIERRLRRKVIHGEARQLIGMLGAPNPRIRQRGLQFRVFVVSEPGERSLQPRKMPELL
jgi:hypothetical protein